MRRRPSKLMAETKERQREKEMLMTPGERFLLALKLGQRDFAFYCAGQKLTPKQAREKLREHKRHRRNQDGKERHLNGARKNVPIKKTDER